MKELEHDRVERLSQWYLNEQIDFDKKLIHFRYLSIKPFLKGPFGLEMGPAEGEMTQYLKDDFHSLTLIDGSKSLLDLITPAPNLVKVHSLFEDYQPSQKFDTIIMEHILEHVDEPKELLKMVKSWLKPAGRLIVGVPNANSIHRLVAVKMGLLKTPDELNSRDLGLGHRRVYSWATLKAELESGGIKVVDRGGVFFKPLSNGQIQQQWSNEMIMGFYELGKDFPDLAAEIFAVCELP